MKPPNNIILGLLGAGALVAGFLQHQGSMLGPQEHSAKDSAASATTSPAKPQTKIPDIGVASLESITERPEASAIVATPVGLKKSATEEIGEIPPSELQRRVEIVENRANRELEQLIGLLKLTDTQQDEIFTILVGKSEMFHPTMLVQGTPEWVGEIPSEITVDDGKSKDEAIYDALDPDQAEEFEEEVLDRVTWWQDVMGDFMDEEVPVP